MPESEAETCNFIKKETPGYWAKVKPKHFFNKNNAFKRNTSLFCFFMFFRTNVFQVKLDNISFLFKFNRRHTNYETIKFLRLCLQNSNRNEKVNTYVKHLKQPHRGFLQSRFYDTLTLK